MDKDYKHLGAANGWLMQPQELKECEKQRHKQKEQQLGNCYHEYTCDICNIKYTVDSSD